LAAQERLLKAMAREEVAAILNDMAPDDRTTLLEELPATVTKQMLVYPITEPCSPRARRSTAAAPSRSEGKIIP
jgi:magnesium transporter